MKHGLLLLSLLNSIGGLSAQHAIDCGTLGKKACGYRDWEYYNIGWGFKKCDSDLKERNGYCVNDQRFQYPKETGWLAWAMKEQMYGISRHQPINRLPLFAAHNAFSNIVQGFSNPVYANHYYSVSSLLNMGVRHLELDPHYYPVNPGAGGDAAVRLCHSGTAEACLVPGYGSRLFSLLLIEIRNWLRANPNEILVLKLDEKNIDAFASRGFTELYAELDRYLGSYAYRPPGGPVRWPTPFEIRSADKQVVIAQHGKSVRGDGEGFVWDAHTFVLENNWPVSQDFNTCTAYDGTTALTRPSMSWWDVAEGRSLSNMAPIGDSTGLLTPTAIRRAINCGVGLLGMDYLKSLSSAPVGTSFAADHRSTATIWSFEEGDFGTFGPAALNVVTQRWNSTPETQSKPLACAKIRDKGEPFDIRGWKITSAKHPWNRAIGNATCFAEFGKEYEFAAPANGFQNRQLLDLAREAGITEGVWINYSTEPRGVVAVSESDIVFTMNPGASMPDPQPLNFYGIIGSQASAEVTVPWLRAGGLTTPIPIPQAGYVPVTLGLQEAAVRALSPGVYTTNVTLRSTLTPVEGVPLSIPISVPVTLIIKQNVAFTVRAAQTTVPYGGRVRILSAFPLMDPKVTGTTSFVRISASDPVATAVEVATNGQEQYADFENLPPGKHRFAAAYSGDAYFQPSSSSNEVEVTVLPRIGATPAALDFVMDYGGSVPATVQSITVARAASGLTATKPCSWLQVVVASATQVQTSLVAAQAQALAPGSYSCDVTLSDSLSATQGSTVVPVTLRIRTSLSATPSTVEFLTAAETQVREVFVTTPGNRTVDIAAVSNQSWLGVEIPLTPTAPKNIVVTGRPAGLSPGVYTGRVTITSSLAVAPAYVDVTMYVVRETVVDTTPSGLQVVVDNNSLVAPASFIWKPGTTHQLSIGTYQQLDPSSGTRYRFGSWTPSAAQTHNVVAQAGGSTHRAAFSTEYRLSTDVVPAGTGSVTANPASGDGYYSANTLVQVSAAAAGGKYFTGWTGNVTGTATPVSVTMNAPKSAVAHFANAAAVNFPIASPVNTSITLNGNSYPVPGTVPMVPGVTYTLVAPSQVGGGDSRWLFTGWQGITNQATLQYTAPASATTLTLAFQRQFLVTVTASPASGGTVAGGGWVNAQATAAIQATANSGFRFTGFSGGGLSSASPNPVTIGPVTQALQVVANFAATGTPTLSAASTGVRTDGPGAGQRTVPFVLRNSGSGPAVDATITGIANIQVLSGSGVVTAADVLPLSMGTISAPGQSAGVLRFNWPSTATRIQFTVRFSANGGAYSGSTTLSLFR